MIPLRKENTLVRGGAVQATATSSIRATPEMFDLLSAAIYKNPIQAVVREYLANAADSRDARDDESTRIDVTLPSSLNPVFKVRDYGKGMSPSFVMELFKDYGFSDKQTSNSKIGGFGIGSKSAYAYTDSFTVRSWQNGGVSTYECSKNPNGGFGVTLRGSRYSEEPSGVEITVPVKAQDYSTFNRWAQYYCAFLEQFRGCVFTGVRTDTFSFNRITDDLYTYNDQQRLTQYDNLVVMGGIPYKLGESVVNADESRVLGDKAIFIQPIGSVEVTASREEVRLSEHTRGVLKGVVSKAVQDKLKHHVDALNACTTEWEKYLYTNKELRSLYTLIPDCVQSITVTGTQYNITRTNNLITNKYNYNDTETFRYGYDTPCLIVDTDKWVPSRFKMYLQTKGIKTGYGNVNVYANCDLAEWDEKGIPYEKLSDYEPLKLPRQKGTSKGPANVTKGEALVVYLKPYISYGESSYSNEQKLDLDNLPSNVYYYNRETEELGVIAKLDILKKFEDLKEYKIISATKKNLTKLQSSGVPKILEYLDGYTKSDTMVPLWSYIVRHNYRLPTYEELCNLNHMDSTRYPSPTRNYSGTLGYATSLSCIPWDALSSALPKLAASVTKTMADNVVKEIEDTIKAMKAVSVNGVSLYDAIDWSSVSDYKKLLGL